MFFFYFNPNDNNIFYYFKIGYFIKFVDLRTNKNNRKVKSFIILFFFFLTFDHY